jgi:hypothetical protein
LWVWDAGWQQDEQLEAILISDIDVTSKNGEGNGPWRMTWGSEWTSGGTEEPKVRLKFGTEVLYFGHHPKNPE